MTGALPAGMSAATLRKACTSASTLLTEKPVMALTTMGPQKATRPVSLRASCRLDDRRAGASLSAGGMVGVLKSLGARVKGRERNLPQRGLRNRYQDAQPQRDHTLPPRVSTYPAPPLMSGARTTTEMLC